MPELIAIDVLLEPDTRIHELALSYNQQFLRRVPPPLGIELGPARVPHVTVVQRFVRSESLTDALEAVGAVARTTDRSVFDLVTDGAPRAGRPCASGEATVLWWVRTGPSLVGLHSALLHVLEPYVSTGGDARAFVRTAAEPDISGSTISYVERFVPEHSGANYRAHLTLGRAAASDVAALAAAPSDPIPFTCPAIAVHQLGDHGTARRQLARWAR